MANKTLMMDYYQLTMAYAYYKSGKKDEIAYFDMFYRKNPDNGGYVISAGLDEVINYVKNFKFSDSDIEVLRQKGDFDEEFLTYLKGIKFTGDIFAVEDGTVVFPNEPILTVRANIIEAQLLETAILLHKNFANLIATKTARIKKAAGDSEIIEFGARRAHEKDASIKGAKYAYIGGAIGSSLVQAEKEYGVPAFGTMAHSYIESFDSEYEAFLTYAKIFPEKSVFLIDTYDTLNSGIENAIKVAEQYLNPQGYRLKGVRLDSGDLAYLSKVTRERLDQAGMNDCKILASNSLDENKIAALNKAGAAIDIFGVGENLITAKSHPVIGGVYKLVAIEKNEQIIPKIKLSENVEKIINPGYKKLYRFYDKDTNMAQKDLIILAHEDVEQLGLVGLDNCYVRELQVPIFVDGQLVYEKKNLEQVKEKVKKELSSIDPEIKKLNDPWLYDVDLSKNLLKLKRDLIVSQKMTLPKAKTLMKVN